MGEEGQEGRGNNTALFLQLALPREKAFFFKGKHGPITESFPSGCPPETLGVGDGGTSMAS